jgi:hypothetical protein
MSNRCVHCNEAWGFDDYVCPCCNRCAVEQDSYMTPTLKYVGLTEAGKRVGMHSPQMKNYDVIRISTNKSVFEEPDNYMNQDDAA